MDVFNLGVNDDVFRPSWFSIQPPHQDIIDRRLQQIDFNFIKPNNFGIAKSLGENRRILNMRFSKRSTPLSFSSNVEVLEVVFL